MGSLGPQVKTALITGACSGMGLELTRHLLTLKSDTVTWRVVLADINTAAYDSIKSTLDPERTLFQPTDVSSWDSSASTFLAAYNWPSPTAAGVQGRIDFFAANAGIADREHVFAHFDLDAPPAPPDLKCLEVNLHAVFLGLKLFIHYTRKTQKALPTTVTNFNPNMVITASSASLYPFAPAPQYSASKHALLGLTRAVGPRLLADDNIAVNCICPAFVATGLAPPGVIASVPPEHLTPMSTVIRAFDELGVMPALDPTPPAQVGKVKVRRHTGQAVECVEAELFYRDPVPYMCEGSRWLADDEVNGGFWDQVRTGGIGKGV